MFLIVLCVCVSIVHPTSIAAVMPSRVIGICSRGYNTKYWENMWSVVPIGLILKQTKKVRISSLIPLTLLFPLCVFGCVCVHACSCMHTWVFLSDRWDIWYVWKGKKEKILLLHHSTFILGQLWFLISIQIRNLANHSFLLLFRAYWLYNSSL